MQFYNRGVKAHLLAAQHLIDDDHFVFTNFCGVGPIDLVRLNIHSGTTELFDVKTDNDRAHRKREHTELQRKLGVKLLEECSLKYFSASSFFFAFLADSAF